MTENFPKVIKSIFYSLKVGNLIQSRELVLKPSFNYQVIKDIKLAKN